MSRKIITGALIAVVIGVVVALFVSPFIAAQALVRAAGVDAVWSTDAFAHETNAVSIVPMVVGALRGLGTLTG